VDEDVEDIAVPVSGGVRRREEVDRDVGEVEGREVERDKR